MKKLYLNTGKFDTIFNDLKDSFGGKLTTESNEYNLTIQSKWAKGSISGMRFEKEMAYMHFDLTFHKDVTLSMESFQTSPVFFVYCTQGDVTHSFGATGVRKKMKSQQSGILANTSSINSVLYFEGFKRTQFTVIGMPTNVSDNVVNAQFIAQLKNKFVNESGNYIFVGPQNSKIVNKLHELKAISQKGTVKDLLQRSILNSVVEMEIAQHSNSFGMMINPILDLANRQFDEIKKLSTINIYDVINAAGVIGRNYLPRVFKEKYHVSYKPYNQKLAS
ncbi:hypothetical protein [Flavobacterium hercynium]|uniref:AraC family transcriptional regulator n=1 Tax=Flavobacterium hercynium TaxID=387094 RepID=A0A226HAD6_9FLAO|nr:hypothetical protein [Flavobacterium hercynium]OXA91247.1 hypothetical protein B0A66_11765 [Flavobacterium hercynium]SMP12266.1 hypothetical protein SAMN06265346_103229 [Flavobacterium hercynium]